MSKENKISQGQKIAGLAINLFFPGIGTFLFGKKYIAIGVVQIILAIIGVITLFVLIGFVILPAVWIWALVLSIMQVSKEE